MARRKKTGQEESYETTAGFQIEDLEGNPVDDDEVVMDELLDEDDEAPRRPVTQDRGKNNFWNEDGDDEDEPEEDEHFNSIADNNDWEEGYDY